MFTKFSDLNIFADPAANTACNLLYQMLMNLEDPANIFLTGQASRILQGEAPTPVGVISFATANPIYMKFLRAKLNDNLGGLGAAFLSDQIMFRYSSTIFIEIWLLDLAPETTDVDGLIIHYIDNIPNYIQ